MHRRCCFSITPRWTDSAAGTGLRGEGHEGYDLVGDHVSVLPVQHGVTLGSLRRATWSPTKLCYAGYTPHEGHQYASLPSAIVGLSRNNLSEVFASLPAPCTPHVGFIVCLCHGNIRDNDFIACLCNEILKLVLAASKGSAGYFGA